MMKTFVTAALCVLIFQATKAQTGIYKTYADFKAGMLDKQDEEGFTYSISNFGVVLKFKSPSGETVKYKGKDFWGFLFKGNLFRKDGLDIDFVVDTGKVCYYENGMAHLDMVISEKDYGTFTFSSFSYLSQGLDAKIYRMPSTSTGQAIIGNNKEYKKFKKEYPEHEDLYDCLDNTENYKKVRACIKQYNHK